MRRIHLVLHAAIFLAIAVVTGCNSAPVVPDTQTPESAAPKCTAAGATHHCLGYSLLALDTESRTAEVLPLRSGEWHLNVTGILNVTMGVSATMVPGESDPAHGLFVLDITLTHPFATKPQLSGFDVKGVLVTPGTLQVGNLVFADIGETRLENADGYTRWWNPTEFTSKGMFGWVDGVLATATKDELTATVNPYKLFTDILYPTSSLAAVCYEPLDNPKGRAVFTAGESNTRRYSIRFPMSPGPKIVYGYAIDCAWKAPSPNPPVEIPDDFPIEANQPEAYRVAIQATANTLYYDADAVGGGVGGGVLRLQINVHDWQGQMSGDIPAEVALVRIYAPGLMTGGVSAVLQAADADKAIYTADLTGIAKPSQAGETLVICRVQSSDGSTYKQTSAPAPTDPLSAFNVLTLDIPDPECVTDTNNDFPEAVEIGIGEAVADQLCVPDDERDFYCFEIPLGYEISGEIRLYCDASPTQWRLYDESQVMKAMGDVTDGLAVVKLGGYGLMPGKCYFKVETGNTNQVVPFLVELDAEFANVTPANPVEVTPSTLYVNPKNVWIDGNYAYMSGQGIWVYDISDPSNPVQIVSDLSVLYVDTACFHYPYLYYTKFVTMTESQINMFDFSDPTSPVLHEDVIHIMERLASICMNSTHLFVGTYTSPTSNVMIYDCAADPFSPVGINQFPVDYNPLAMTLLDPEGPETRLVLSTLDELLSFDVEDPTNITPCGSFAIMGGAVRDLAGWGDYVYVGYDDTGGGDGWIFVLEQTDVPALEWRASLDLPTGCFASHLAVNWPYVYVGDGLAGLTICDVTDPVSPQYVSSTPLVSYGDRLDVRDDLAYVIPKGAGLQIFDVSTPETPSELTRLPVLNRPMSVAAAGDYLLAAENTEMHWVIKTIDISDPLDARLVGEHFLNSAPWGLDLDDNLLAVRCSGNTWSLFDATDPVNLQEGASNATANPIREIAVHKDAVYISAGAPGTPEVLVYDATDFTCPAYKTTVNPASEPTGFSFAWSHMYLATDAGVEVYSVSDPFNPVLQGTYTPSFQIAECVVQYSRLCIAGEAALEIADLSDPASPVFAGFTAAPDLAMITSEEQFAYACSVDGQPCSYWIWPPDSPALLGPVCDSCNYGCMDLLAYEGYLYEAGSVSGLHIFDLY